VTDETVEETSDEAKPTGDAGDVMLDALWRRVDEAWDDDKPHHALLEYAITAQRLPDVAGRYRAMKDKDPERAVRAQKKLDGIVIAATQMLMAMKTPADQAKPSRALTLGVAIVGIIVIVWLAFAMLRRPS
jgi:hypothetical protein